MFGLVGAGCCVHAADFYVSPSGKDSNSGTSLKAPWKTLKRVNRTPSFIATRSPVARRNTASNEGGIDSIDENATARVMFPFIGIARIPHGHAILYSDPRMRPRTPPRRIASVHHDSGIAVTRRQAPFDSDAFKPHRALAGIHHDSVPSEARHRTVLNHHTGHSLEGFLVPIAADAIA